VSERRKYLLLMGAIVAALVGAILLAVPGLVLLLLGQRYLVRAFGGGGLAN
jgi:ABC-type maltose transport system permease subunit